MKNLDTTLFTTFYVGERLYGVDVMKVQEITKAMALSPVPLAPKYVHGLINLRGQIATAIGLRELFHLDGTSKEEPMNIVCEINNVLMSFIVDRIGDVIEVSQGMFEETPDTVPQEIKQFMTGICKLPEQLLSIVDIDSIFKNINS